MKEPAYNVAEHFISINGEGPLAGQLALFIRFTRCNLSCEYCDTKWANESDCPFERMTLSDIMELVRSSGITNITLTGGEPLIQKDVDILIDELLKDEKLHVEIETNGSVFLQPFIRDNERLSFTMDYKLACSGMESRMNTDNFSLLKKTDSVKFVSGSRDDLERAYDIIKKYSLIGNCRVYFSAVFGMIEPDEIVSFMIENRLNHTNLQLQLHKYIWDPMQRGV